ncbi:MAG: glycosyltransferase family 2 protein, partial [Ferruginibacter sp.]|nr:glycosyltransferase family 2 protein [Chitinophagaceae bacterium]
MIKFSVIIPNYNHADFLKERIDSALSQTHAPSEVIILDDASTDHSREVIETFSDHPLLK